MMMKTANCNMSVAKQKGLTLIELLIALVIGAAILFGVFYVAQVVSKKNKVSEAVQSMNTITADVSGLYQSVGNYAGISGVALINNGKIPASMVSGTTIQNQFGGTIVPTSISFNGGTNNAVNYAYSNVPKDSCSNLVQALAGTFDRITVGGTVVLNKSTGTLAGTQLNVNSLGTACNATPQVTINFVKAS